MDLKAKLARLGAPGAKPAVPTASPAATTATPSGDARVQALRAQLAAFTEKQRERQTRVYKRPAAAKPHHLPGSLLSTAAGDIQCVTTRFPLGHKHGLMPIGVGHGFAPAVLAFLAHEPAFAQLDVSRLLFLDTETTGLSGGTGTLAFLVGLGFFEGDDFVVEQLFMSQLSQEAALLAHLGMRLGQASAVVSYNGKSFDWPLLRTRFVMNRATLPELQHLDLLHAARRLFRYRLPGFRLQQVEAELLKHVRVDDIPGAEIPTRYWEFLRSGDGALVTPIVEHNRDDIVALPATLSLMHQAVHTTEAHADPRISLGVARLAYRQGRTDWALKHVALAEGGDAMTATTALRLKAQHEWRQGDFAQALATLQQALAHAPRQGEMAAQVHLRLAKLCEHKLKDFKTALTHAAHTGLAEGTAHQARRERRLRRKLGKGEATKE